MLKNSLFTIKDLPQQVVKADRTFNLSKLDFSRQDKAISKVLDIQLLQAKLSTKERTQLKWIIEEKLA